MYVPQNEDTLSYFHRFNRIKIGGQPWEVQAVDSISTPGIIQVSLKETYNNTIQEDVDLAVEQSIDVDIVDEKEDVYIHGAVVVYPYDIKSYELRNYNENAGSWFVENESRAGSVKLEVLDDNKVEVTILTGRSGKFTLVYKANDQLVAALDITIESI
jgi:hypothetical protein